jgi:hypothetical protein
MILNKKVNTLCNSIFTPEDGAVMPIVAFWVKLGYFITLLSHYKLRLKS